MEVPSILVGVLLVGSIVLVHFSTRRRPLPGEYPLNVDEGLAFPEAGQGSTVFSLTALFGAYFGIFLVLGLPAALGLAVGTILALFLIRASIKKDSSPNFESFLLRRLDANSSNGKTIAALLSGTQLAYATSELLILQQISTISLGVHRHHATMIVIGLAVVAYIYVLIGGYDGVFRTDIVQFIFVLAMGISLFLLPILPSQVEPHMRSEALLPRAGYWNLPAIAPIKYAYHFCVGGIMGAGFLLASPDSWKRVFTVTRIARGRSSRQSFTLLVFAGVLPFALLAPLALTTVVPDGAVSPTNMFGHILANRWLFVVVLLGLFSSFLSSYDSATISAVHVALLRQRPVDGGNESPRFHWLMAMALVISSLAFLALMALGNPYLLANLLMGPFALAGGVILGTRGILTDVRSGVLAWLSTIALTLWCVYVLSWPGILESPVTYQVNTVPAGALLFVVSAVAGVVARRRSS